jgi:hypothetical protein
MNIKNLTKLFWILFLQTSLVFSPLDGKNPYPTESADTLKITWTSPLKKITEIKSASARVKATFKPSAGLSSVVLYLNGVRYGEPDMQPSPSEMGSFILSKSLNLEPGENRVYFLATKGNDTLISEKRFFIVGPKKPDSAAVMIPPSLSFKWITPTTETTVLKSATAKIKANLQAPSGLSSVVMYVNDVPYGEPEMNPSPTELASFILSKSLVFETGKNSVHFIASAGKDTITSGKKYFIYQKPERPADSVTAFLAPVPEITWTNPVGRNSNLKSSSAEIKAKVKSASGLTSITIYLNNVPLSNEEIKPSPDEAYSYVIEKTINFRQVENNIVIEAKSASGRTISETRYFVCPLSSLTASKTTQKPENKVSEPNTISRETITKPNEANPSVSGDAAIKNENAPVITGNQTRITETGNAESKPGAPVITWKSPSGSHTNLDVYYATVKASIKSKSGLNSVLLYLNGVSKGESAVKASDEAETYMIEKPVNFGPGENTIYLVATNNEGTSKSDVRYFTNPMAVQPVITWSNLSSGTVVVNTENVNIEAIVKSPTELKSIKLIVNGETQSESNVFQPSGSDNSIYNFKNSVILRNGENGIYINATNVAGSKISEKRVIKYEPLITEKRLALVFGNSEYKKGTSLKNPVNDANLMEGTLKELGFDVIKRLNAGKAEMIAAIKEFTEKLPNYNVALFYYAGHGNQVDGKNFLIPTDALLEKATDCKFEAIGVDFVVDEFERYQDNTNIVILDACRNNPYASWARGGEAGFRQITFSSGTIIAFATSEGATAADGKGENGLYTEELVKQMSVPQSLHNVFLNTRNEVRKKSNNQQIPMEWDKLNSDFYLKK